MSLGSPPQHGERCTKLPRIVLKTSRTWFRICDHRHPNPLYYGRTGRNRFDDPSGRFGVLYLADSVDCAFAETFGHSVSERYDPLETKLLAVEDLRSRRLWSLWPIQDLRVADFSGPGLARLNLDGSINTTGDRNLSQAWAAWIHSCQKGRRRIDGILYNSRHYPQGQCLAVFNSAKIEWRKQKGPSLDAWSDPVSGRDIWDLLEEQGWGVLPDNWP